MGAKYAPSVANIFQNKWEDENILTGEWPQLKLYKRYIDDVFFICEGTLEELEGFMSHMNSNRYNVKLTEKWIYEKIQYLDLEIFNNRIYTKNFF